MAIIPSIHNVSLLSSLFKPLAGKPIQANKVTHFNQPPITISIAKDIAEMPVHCIWNRSLNGNYEVHKGGLFDCLLGGIENYLWLLAENPEKKGIVHLENLFHPEHKPWNYLAEALYANHFSNNPPVTNQYTLKNNTNYLSNIGEHTELILAPKNNTPHLPTYRLLCTIPPKKRKEQSNQLMLFEFGTVSAGTWQRQPELEAHLAQEVQRTLDALKYYKTPTPQQAMLKKPPF
jgi:hypothetical protein